MLEVSSDAMIDRYSWVLSTRSNMAPVSCCTPPTTAPTASPLPRSPPRPPDPSRPLSPPVDVPASSMASPRSSTSPVVLFSWLSNLLRSARASFTAWAHRKVLVSVSPNLLAAASRPRSSWASFCFWASIWRLSTSVWAARASSLRSPASKEEVTAFISLPRVRSCWLMLVSSCRNSFSPSIPIFGPMSTAK